MNALVHGCKEDPGRKSSVALAAKRNKGILIVVRDPGPGFDPASVPSPVVGQNIFSEHGRGIFLINQMMDEVTLRKWRDRDPHENQVGVPSRLFRIKKTCQAIDLTGLDSTLKRTR